MGKHHPLRLLANADGIPDVRVRVAQVSLLRLLLVQILAGLASAIVNAHHLRAWR